MVAPIALPLVPLPTAEAAAVPLPTFAIAQHASARGGEPTLGVNWNTGHVFYMSGVTPYRVVYNDAVTPPTATWTSLLVPAAATVANIDPMLFTDLGTGRTFAGGLDGECSSMAFTDDNGATWTPTGNQCAGAFDHQTIGQGPWREPRPTQATYHRATYYCAQGWINFPENACVTSWDGGITYGPPIMWQGNCFGLHGHVNVSPNGKAYVPTRNCQGSKPGFAWTEDNGASWKDKAVAATNSPAKGFDPAVGASRNGRIWFAYESPSWLPMAGFSDNDGATFGTFKNVGADAGIQTATFIRVASGDPERAAVIYLGSTTDGNPFANTWNGVWDLYVSFTYDSGTTWSTVKVTSDPVQRGWMCADGTTCGSGRNLLDFMGHSLGPDGSLYIAYPDGCVGACAGPSGTASQSTNARNTIARQIGGRTLFAEYDGGNVVVTTPNILGTEDLPISLGATVAVTTPYSVSVTWGDGETTTLTGQSSTVLNLPHTYADPGQYPIGLTVTDADSRVFTGSAQATIAQSGGGGGGLGSIQISSPEEGERVSGLVTISGIVGQGTNTAPVAAFDFTTSGRTASFDATGSSDADGDVLAFSWNFGDATTGTGATPSHTYAVSGTYDVCLDVSDGIAVTQICHEVTVTSGGSQTTLATDDEDDVATIVPGAWTKHVDILSLGARLNPDGSPTFNMTLLDFSGGTTSIDQGASATVWRVEWKGPGGRIDYVDYTETPLESYCESGSLSGGIYSPDGVANCAVSGEAPAHIELHYPLSVLTSKGYTNGFVLENVTASTLYFVGAPQNPTEIFAGGTLPADETTPANYPLSVNNPLLGRVQVPGLKAALPAPTTPPANPEIVDPAGDVGLTLITGTPKIPVPHAALDARAAWFQADGEYIYVGLKVEDIPASSDGTLQLVYDVFFMPSWTPEDPTWGDLVDGELTGLSATASFTPIRFDQFPTPATAPVLELAAYWDDPTFGASVGTVARVTGSIDATTDIIWWQIPRADLQDPPMGARLEATGVGTGFNAVAFVFNGATDQNDAPGRDFVIPGTDTTPPIVTLNAAPLTGPAPLDVLFTYTTDALAAGTTWEYLFGDGTTADGIGLPPATVSHIYETAGEFTATLRITENGLTGSATRTIVAGGGSQGIVVEVLAGGLVPTQATCAASCSTWSTTLDVSSLADGPLQITARLLQNGAQRSVDTVNVLVENLGEDAVVIDAPLDGQRVPQGAVRVQGRIGGADRNPLASLSGAPLTGVVPLDVSFDLGGADDKGIVSWRFTTGDGRVVDGTALPTTVAHTYSAVGEYSATLVVRDTGGQTDTVAIGVVVRAENRAPDAPVLIAPLSGATGLSTPPLLSWSGSDPDLDSLTYDVYLDTGSATTLVLDDTPGTTYSPPGLLGGTTYSWKVVASDGMASASSPVWTFTTKAPEGLATRSHVVVAYIDTGGNPYHEQFRRAEYVEHPSTYISGYPSTAKSLNLCFFDPVTKAVELTGTGGSGSACPASAAAAPTQDASEWAAKTAVTPDAQTGAGQGALAYVPGTNIVGWMSFGHDGNAGFPGLDGSKGNGDEHGTWVAGSIGGKTSGSCPECLIVVIEADTAADIVAGYNWAANQPWIDLVTSSYVIGSCPGITVPVVGIPVGECLDPAGLLTQADDAARNVVTQGKIFFESAGNGIFNFGVFPVPTITTQKGNPWSVAVGCSTPTAGQSCLYHNIPAPITATGADRMTTMDDEYAGIEGAGGTSFSSPTAAGVAGRALLNVRVAMGDVGEGPAAGTKSLVRPASGATLPAGTALTNGILTRLELEEALFKTARRGIVPKTFLTDDESRGYIIPTEVPDNLASFVKDGYGQVYRGDHGIAHTTALTGWSSSSEAAGVLLGTKAMPNRYLEETWWEKVVEPAQVAAYGAEIPDPDADAWPKNDAPDADGLDGNSAPVRLPFEVPTSSQRTVVQGVPPAVGANKLYFHHERNTDETYRPYLNTVADPGVCPADPTPADGSSPPCDDRSGVGNLVPGQTIYTVSDPTPAGTLLLEQGGKIKVHLMAGGWAGEPALAPSVTVTVTSQGAIVAQGDVMRGIPDTTSGDSPYDGELAVTASALAHPIEVTITRPNTAPSWFLTSRGASWMEFPFKAGGSLPPLTYTPVTYLADNVASAAATNPGSGTLTRNAAKLTGDAEYAGVKTFPQMGGSVINWVGDDALVSALSLPGSGGTFNLHVCMTPVADGGVLQDFTVSVMIGVGSTTLGGGSVTTSAAGINPYYGSPLVVPFSLAPALIQPGQAITATLELTSVGDILPQNVRFCRGGPSAPWSLTLPLATLGEGTPTATVEVPTGAVGGTVRLEGDFEAPATPGVANVVWHAQDMALWDDAQTDVLTLAVAPPGTASPGLTFPPQPNGLNLKLKSADPVVANAATLSANGVGRAQFWVTSLNPSIDTRVDMTVLLEDGTGAQRLLGSGSVTKTITSPIGTVAVVRSEKFVIDFTPKVTDPRADEKLVLLVKITNPTGTSTLETCLCGDAAQPVFVSLPLSTPTNPTTPEVVVDVGALSQTVVPSGGRWTLDVDTTLLGDGAHDVTATPRATYGAVVRPGLGATGTLTVQNTAPNLPPVVTLLAGVPSGPAPASVAFDLSATDDQTAASALTWTVVWGDGATAAGTGLPTTLTHVYAAPGPYTAVATVTDGHGAQGTDDELVTILAPPPVKSVRLILDGGAPIAAVDDAGDGSFAYWHADLDLTLDGLYEILAQEMFGDDVVSSDTILVRVNANGVPEVEIEAPLDGAIVHGDTTLAGRVTRYSGDEPTGTPVLIQAPTGPEPLAKAFGRVANALGPVQVAPPVVSRDLTVAFTRFLQAAGQDPSQAPVWRAKLGVLSAEKEAALASIVEATALAMEHNRAANGGLSADQFIAAMKDPITAAGVQTAPELRTLATMRLLATIDAALPALRKGPAPISADAPDLNQPGLIAIDLAGDTTYTGKYILVIDLAGNDVRNDNAGAAGADVAVSIDVDGNDQYVSSSVAGGSPPAPVLVAYDHYASQGASSFAGIGILVDAAGNDVYTSNDDIAGSATAGNVALRAAQGAATGGVGVLADLAGNDVYTAALTGKAGVARWTAAAQGASTGFFTGTPGLGLLLDQSGDDRYTATGWTAGAAPNVDAASQGRSTGYGAAPGAALFADLGGNDADGRGDFVALPDAPTTGAGGFGSGLYLDTDADKPSADVTTPTAGATLAGTVTLRVDARDLGDMPAQTQVQNNAPRRVTSVTARIDGGPVLTFTKGTGLTTIWSHAGYNTALLADGAHTIVATVTSQNGGVTTQTVSFSTLNNAAPNMVLVATAVLDTPTTTPSVKLNFTGTSDAETPFASLAFSVDWGDGTIGPVTLDAEKSVTHAYAPGVYTIVATVTDGGGRTDSETRLFDLDAPGIASAVSTLTHESATIGVTLDQAGTVLASLGTVSGSGTTWTVTLTGLSPETTYDVVLTATDAAGNSAQATQAFTTNALPNDAPIVVLDGPAALATGATGAFTVSVTDPDGDAVTQVVLDWGDGTSDTVALVEGAASADHAFLAKCSCTVTATVTDARGAIGSDAASVVVNAVPLVTTNVPLVRVPAREDFALLVTVTDADNDAVTPTLTVDGIARLLREVDESDTTTSDGKLFRYVARHTSGQHAVVASATDGTSSASAAATLSVNAPPVLSGTVTPYSGTPQTTFTYYAGINDLDGDAVTVSLLVDAQAPVDMGAGPSYQHARTLPKGQHRYAFVATDGIDTVRFPDPAGFHFGPIVGAVSQVQVSRFEDFSSFVVATATPDFSSFQAPFGSLGLPEGQASPVYVRAVDEDSGPASPSMMMVTYDDAPGAAIEVLTSLPVPTGSDVTFQGFGTPSARGDAIVGYAWTFGDGGTSALNQPTHVYADDGTYLVTLTVTDEGGRTGSATQSVTILNRAPAAVVTVSPEVLTPIDVATITLAGTDPDGTIVGRSIEVHDGPTTESPIFANGGASTLDVTFPDDGQFLVVGTVVDDDGDSARTEMLVTVLNHVPTAALTVTPNPAVSGQDVTFDATASLDPDGSITQYTFDAGDGSAPVVVSTPGFVHRYATTGLYHVTVTVRDDDGGTATSTPVALTVINSAPTFGTLPDVEIQENDLMVFFIEASDPDGHALTFRSEPLPSGATLHPTTGEFRWRPSFTQAGVYPIVVTIDDGNDVATDDFLVTVHNTDRAPTLQALGSRTVMETNRLMVWARATDADGDPIVLTTSPLPSGATFTDFANGTALFDWTPAPGQHAGYTITVTATSHGLTATSILTVTVEFKAGVALLRTSGTDLKNSPGQARVLTALVTNTGPNTDTMTFTVFANGWPATVPAPVELAPGESADVSFTVTTPNNSDLAAPRLTAHSAGDPRVLTSVSWRIDVPVFLTVTLEATHVTPGLQRVAGVVRVAHLDGTPATGSLVSLLQTPDLGGYDLSSGALGFVNATGEYSFDLSRDAFANIIGGHDLLIIGKKPSGYTTSETKRYTIGAPAL